MKIEKKVFNTLRRYGFLKNVPDSIYLKCLYYYNLGKKLNLKTPKTFNEKLQWLKINDRKPFYTMLVDKYEVKKYVADIIGQEHIIPTLGVWDTFDEIDFESLPEQFVLKCTHDSGGLVLCRDKKSLDIKKAKTKIEASLNNNYYYWGREWPYKNVKPRIIAEPYLDNGNGLGLVDYKFYCFDGVPKYLYVSEGLENHSTAKISFLNMDWTFAPFGRSDYKPFEKLPIMPEKFSQMESFASKLSKDFKFIRVDLYEIEGKVFFSELTFYPCSGMMPFNPPEYDEKIGELIKI